jgi:hypothetical protein
MLLHFLSNIFSNYNLIQELIQKLPATLQDTSLAQPNFEMMFKNQPTRLLGRFDQGIKLHFTRLNIVLNHTLTSTAYSFSIK